MLFDSNQMQSPLHSAAIHSVNMLVQENGSQKDVIACLIKENMQLKTGEKQMRNKANQSHNILGEQLKSHQATLVKSNAKLPSTSTDLVHVTKQLKNIQRIQEKACDLMCSLM